MFEYEVTSFIKGILELAGIDDSPTYTRSMIVNQQETIQNVTLAGEYLSQEYITGKILEVLGDIDKVDEVMDQMLRNEAIRYTPIETEDEDATQE